VNPNQELKRQSGPEAGLQMRLLSGMAILLVVTYIIVRGAVSVMERTHASTGDYGLFVLISGSLIYFGIVALVRKWGSIKKDTSPRKLLWVKGAPGFLALGVIALISKVFLERSETEIRAYALRVLIVVCALHTLVHLISFVRKSSMALRERGIVDKQRISELWSYAVGAYQPSTIGWKDMSVWARFFFVSTHYFDAALWTWLVIYYRYSCHSFLGQSSWAMASLWLFVASRWFCCVGLFLCVWPWRAD
jgi:hypothetical protein